MSANQISGLIGGATAKSPIIASAMIATPMSGDMTDAALHRDYFSLHCLDWRHVEVDPGGVEFNLPFSRWLSLFRENGFEVFEYLELKAPDDASEDKFSIAADWAKRWPGEQVWKLRKSGQTTASQRHPIQYAPVNSYGVTSVAGIEKNVDLGYLRIAGRSWGHDDGTPTLALHGYLDNAASFDVLAPALEGLNIFAMDFAGHGWSDHRRPGELYTGLNDIKDVLAVADELGWDQFNIIGHSMGAEVGSQVAGLFPDRVKKLVCLDGFCGTDSAADTLGNLASVVEASFKQGSQLRVFPDKAAMNARLREATGQNEYSAAVLIERGHRRVEGGITWRTDPRIRGSGPLEFTTDQLSQLVDNIEAEVLFIVADRENAWLQRTLAVLEARTDDKILFRDLPAHHHGHMQDEATAIAAMVNSFLADETDTRKTA